MLNNSKPSGPRGNLIEVADRLISHLRHEREAGIAVVEIDSAELEKLSEALPAVGRLGAPDAGAQSVDVVKAGGEPADEVSDGDRKESLAAIGREAAGCKKCGLHATRTNVVPGQGTCRPEIMFIGEAPGADEDEQGLAFVGRAGQLLTRMIAAMGFTREEVFIANILKCRPPDNRPPMPDEMVACLPYLRAQIAVLKPRVIVALGATAVRGLLKVETGITKLRGTWMEFDGIPTMPTLHPAYLLRNPPAKKDSWADLKAVLRRIGREPPPRSG